MRLFFEATKLLFRKLILRQSTGKVVKKFCINMGVVYIKLAQILATQNFGELFTEEDRIELSSICDDCKPIKFARVKSILESEYGKSYKKNFKSIDKLPIGAASVSQVHRGILKSGEIVAIKVKRKDVAKKIDKDIATIKKLVRKFGGKFGLGNIGGGIKALELYLEWIYEETDFINEKENIKIYNIFCDETKNAVDNAKNIRKLGLHESLCTKNIIVMEYIASPTLSKIEMTSKNKNKLAISMNSYLQLSFYALLNDKQVIFHGDPHVGNIYLAKNGDIGFIDLGLLFTLSEEESAMTRSFFFSIYLKQYEKLADMLASAGGLKASRRQDFLNDIVDCGERVQHMHVAAYFTETMNVCLRYEIIPPSFLFCMAKAFICINGINGFSGNNIKASELLKEQMLEYYLRTNAKDGEKFIEKTLSSAPKILQRVVDHGFIKGISKSVDDIEDIYKNLDKMADNYRNFLSLIGATK